MPNTTDFYSQVEAGVMARFRTLSTYFKKPEQVSNDDTVLGRGFDYVAVFRPGSFPVSSASMHEKNFTWNIKVELYIRYTEYRVSWATFKAVRAAIINLLFPDPFLQEQGTIPEVPGVFSVTVSSEEDAQYFFFEEKQVQPNFIIQTLTIQVVQRVAFEF